MAVALTGSVIVVTWSNVQDPTGQSVTIPADATAVYMFWSLFINSGGGLGLASVTLNGVSPNQVHELPVSTVLDTYGVGVTAWYNPATGSRTLDLAWDGVPSGGPICFVACVNGGNTTAWRAVGSDQNSATTAVTTTIASATTDLVLKIDVHNPATPPGTSAGWTSRGTQNLLGMSGRISSVNSPGASTTVCDSENEDYSAVLGVSIPVAAAGNKSAAMYYNRLRS